MAVFLPGQSSDDCYSGPSDFSLDAFYLLLGAAAAGGYSSGIRFVGVTIPQGASILTAKVTFQSFNDRGDVVCNIQIKGENADDPATFSNQANFNGRTRTTEYVNWDAIPAWTANNDYDSPSIINIIQEIVNRAGWVSENHLVLFFANNVSDVCFRLPKSYDYDTTYCARLTVTWSTATHYTLTAEAGSYSMTGQSVGLRAARKMAAAPDSYALTGQAADLKFGRKISAGAGAYALTGQDAVLRAIRKMAAEGGSYALTGYDANLVIGKHYILTAEAGSYGEPYSKIFVTLDGRIYKKMGDTYLRLS